ncbi:MAG: efflux RND transporter periplasmic adaptor subunit [Verrucomicrobia bacterium]|nr:efflux RND transporter periplasmic adaptor subunit [Verrucomicrobiota bacterium]
MLATLQSPSVKTQSIQSEVARTLAIGAPSKRRPMVKRAFILLFVLLALGAAYYWNAVAPRRGPRFETAEAKRGNLTVIVTATGALQPVNTVDVGAEISGRIEKVPADFNLRVKKGDPLAEIDPRNLRAQVERSAASLEAAEASLKQAGATLLEARQSAARAEQLAASKLISDQELDAARATLDRAEASVASANAQVTVSRALLNADRTNLEKAVIRSPIDGVVLARKVEPGQTVAASFQTPVLFKLAEDLSRMKLLVNVDEADVGVVKEGQTATFSVDAFPNREFPARITSLRNEPQTVQGVVSYEAVLSVDNSDGLLRPGMTATATITTEMRSDVLLVPNAALRFIPPGAKLPAQSPAGSGSKENAASYVWTLRDGQPTAIPVKKALTDGRFTEVVSGEVPPGILLLIDVAATRR